MKFITQRRRLLGLGLVGATLMWGIVGCGNLGGTADEANGLDVTQQATNATVFGRLYVADSGSNAVLRFDGASGLQGNTAPGATFIGNKTNLLTPVGVNLQTIGDHLAVADNTSNPNGATNPGAIIEFDNASVNTGALNIAPDREIAPPAAGATDNTTLNAPTSVFIAGVGSNTLLNGTPTNDPTILYVLNSGAGTILNFANAESTATGNVAPQAILSDSLSSLTGATGMVLDESLDNQAGALRDRLYVANPTTGVVTIFPNAGTLQSGDQSGVAIHLTGAGLFRTPTSVTVTSSLSNNAQIFIADPGAGKVFVYDSPFLLTADRAPDSSFTLSTTGLVVDPSLFILYTVNNSVAQILDFPGAQALVDPVSPAATIAGGITGLTHPQAMTIDPER